MSLVIMVEIGSEWKHDFDIETYIWVMKEKFIEELFPIRKRADNTTIMSPYILTVPPLQGW